MQKSVFILTLSFLYLPSAVSGQESTITISSPIKLAPTTLSAPTAVLPVRNRTANGRSVTFVKGANQEPRDSGYQANETGYALNSTESGNVHRVPQFDSNSFNATQSVSRVLINPDQFWTRKDRPIMDSRQHNLFGDPNCACDEWAGFCGCCGLKAEAGHLGQKWLASGEPCECVENCCPDKSCGRCQKCK